MFLATLFLRFLGEIIKFACTLKNTQNLQVKRLQQDVINLETAAIGRPNSTLLAD